MQAIIAGGGIGGLTAALCLHRVGWEVVVLEQAALLDNVGAGIQISPNGVKVLRQLGISDELEVLGFEPECLEMRAGKSGRRIFTVPLRHKAEARWGAPYLHVHRADLIATLAHRLSQQMHSALQLNSRVMSCESADDGVTVVLDNGERLRGDLLIGADGIHSRMRTQLLGEEVPQFTGNVAWRATVPMERLGAYAPPPTACVWTGAGRHAVTYQLRGGTLANIVGVVEQEGWETESWTERGTRAQAMADFAGWHPIVTTALENADEHYRWALFERAPLPLWCRGRIALLGDACHPMLPFLAQGAVMAIEDAWVLSRCLSAQSQVETALQQYVDKRHARTAKVQRGARANMRTFHHRNALLQAGTYGPMWLAGKVLPEFMQARLDWLYGYDILDA